MTASKASRIDLLSLKTPQMRAFHLTWLAFFLCFFGWFGINPMLAIVRADLGLTTDQIVTSNMIAVTTTILMRLLIGGLCDKVGPRLVYSGLLVLGAFPVMLIGLAHDYTTFLIMRAAIGAIGAGFVVTQYHTSLMFAPNCVGTANAVTAGWGNSGAGATHLLMPLLFAAVALMVGSEATAWRLAMIVPGLLLLVMGVAYFFLVQDSPAGNFAALRASGEMPPAAKSGNAAAAFRDPRSWLLFLIYGACFGVELVIDQNIALYLLDSFKLDLSTAGIIASIFGFLGICARPLGGYVADRVGLASGLKGRVLWLFVVLFVEGVLLMVFSQATSTVPMVVMLALTGLFVHMGCGATFAVVPFVNKQSMGAVSGIVGAGGNAMAVALMFLFKPTVSGLSWPDAFFVMGSAVVVLSFVSFGVRFSAVAEKEFRSAQLAALAERQRRLEPAFSASV